MRRWLSDPLPSRLVSIVLVMFNPLTPMASVAGVTSAIGLPMEIVEPAAAVVESSSTEPA